MRGCFFEFVIRRDYHGAWGDVYFILRYFADYGNICMSASVSPMGCGNPAYASELLRMARGCACFHLSTTKKTPDSKGSGGSRNIKYATQFVRLFPTS